MPGHTKITINAKVWHAYHTLATSSLSLDGLGTAPSGYDAQQAAQAGMDAVVNVLSTHGTDGGDIDGASGPPTVYIDITAESNYHQTPLAAVSQTTYQHAPWQQVVAAGVFAIAQELVGRLTAADLEPQVEAGADA